MTTDKKQIVVLLKENAVPLIITSIIIIAYSCYYTLIVLQNKISLINESNIFAEILKHIPSMIISVIFTINYFSDAKVREQELKAMRNSPVLVIMIFLFCIGLFMLFMKYSVSFLYGAIYYFLFVACYEEFLFRAYLYRNIKKKSSFKVAVVLSGILFGLEHWFPRCIFLGEPWYDIFSWINATGLLGTLIFAFMYEKSGTIFVPILVHFLIDYKNIF